MNLRIRSGYSLLVLATLGACPRVHAEDVEGALFACAKLGDDLERVTCYDRLTERVRADVAAHSQIAPAAEAPVQPQPSSSALPLDMFGARPVETPRAAVTRSELKSVTARITAMHPSPTSGTILNLDNGQQWQQLDREDLLLKVGQKVIISRGAFNSFWLMSEANRSSHVKRLL